MLECSLKKCTYISAHSVVKMILSVIGTGRLALSRASKSMYKDVYAASKLIFSRNKMRTWNVNQDATRSRDACTSNENFELIILRCPQSSGR
jgi:hypothetical protein